MNNVLVRTFFWLILLLFSVTAPALAEEGVEGCHFVVRQGDASLTGMIAECPDYGQLSFSEAHYENGEQALASELHLHVGERIVFPRRGESVSSVQDQVVEQSVPAGGQETDDRKPHYKNVINDLGRAPFGYVKSDAKQAQAVRTVRPDITEGQAKEIVRAKRSGRFNLVFVPCGSVIEGNFIFRGGKHLPGGTLLACGADAKHPNGNPEEWKVAFEFCTDDGTKCAYQFDECMNWFGSWIPPKRPTPTPTPTPVTTIPVGPGKPAPPAEEVCHYEPTAFALAGGIGSLDGPDAVAALWHLNVGTHCMKKIGEGEYAGVGVQLLVDGSYWNGQTLNDQPPGTYQNHRPRISLPSFRYWKRSDDGEHQYAFLGGPTFGAAITEGNTDDGRYEMSRAQGTLGVGGNFDIYSKDDEGRFVKNWQLSAGVDVPFTTFHKEHSFDGRPLNPDDLASSSVIASASVRKHIVSGCRPDLPLGGYRVYGQIGGFIALPEVAAADAGVVVTDCSYVFEARLGPSFNIMEGRVSLLGTAGVNFIEAGRVMVDKARTDQVTTKLNKLEQEEKKPSTPPPAPTTH
jgi:hypothetical protein